MTLGELLNQVSHKMSMSDVNPSDDRTFLVRAANLGVERVLRDTACYVVHDTLALSASDGEYELDSNWLSIQEFTNDTDPARASFTLVQGDVLLDRRRRQVAEGSTRRFTLLGSNMLVVEPIPDAAITIQVYGVPRPDNPLSANADDPSDITLGGVPTYFHEAIEAFMCAQAADKLKQFDAATFYRTRYAEEITKGMKTQRSRAGRHRAPARVGYPDAQRPFGRNDLYPNA